MICTRPPKKNAAGQDDGDPALFSKWVSYMPSMNEVVANSVTARGAGLAICDGAADATGRF
jgi:hypothetical protein